MKDYLRIKLKYINEMLEQTTELITIQLLMMEKKSIEEYLRNPKRNEENES
jgi:hypothetical protein